MYKLLVVDDEYEARNTLCHCFPWQETGFEITAQVDNGEDALTFIKNHPIDVVLCDIKMPSMSGIDLASEIFNYKSKPVIVFLSGYRSFEFAQKALAFGVRYYLVKPARYEEIMNTFQKLHQELDAKLEIEKSMQPNFHPQHADTVNFQEKVVQIIKEYIDKNYREANLEDASNLVHINPSYLSQLFKQKTGINFSDYLIQAKMKNAAELLMDYKLKIYTISEMVGYNNAKNFTRTFKSFYGMNPREYRFLNLERSISDYST